MIVLPGIAHINNNKLHIKDYKGKKCQYMVPDITEEEAELLKMGEISIAQLIKQRGGCMGKYSGMSEFIQLTGVHPIMLPHIGLRQGYVDEESFEGQLTCLPTDLIGEYTVYYEKGEPWRLNAHYGDNFMMEICTATTFQEVYVNLENRLRSLKKNLQKVM